MDADNKKGKFIGNRQIQSVTKTEEKTPGGFSIIEVKYEDGNTEWFSSLMFEKMITERACDASELREKRVGPVVQVMITILRDWGIKIGELPYMSTLLNQSLDFNSKEAILELWSKWMPRPVSPEDVDFINIDRVLRTIKEKPLTIKDVISRDTKQ